MIENSGSDADAYVVLTHGLQLMKGKVETILLSFPSLEMLKNDQGHLALTPAKFESSACKSRRPRDGTLDESELDADLLQYAAGKIGPQWLVVALVAWPSALRLDGLHGGP